MSHLIQGFIGRWIEDHLQKVVNVTDVPLGMKFLAKTPYLILGVTMRSSVYDGLRCS